MQSLVDTGADRSLISDAFYAKLIKSNSRTKLATPRQGRTSISDPTGRSLHIVGSVDTDIRVNGMVIPFTFDVVQGLSIDLILGVDFLKFTQASVDFRVHALDLFHGMTSVPLIQHGTLPSVVTVANLTIPPNSEAVFPVRPTKRLPKGTFIIEQAQYPPLHRVFIARTLHDDRTKNFMCRVLNPTDRQIKLRRKTLVGNLTAVDVVGVGEAPPSPDEGPPPSITQMREALAEKEINLADTALEGEDLDRLIGLLYRNRDVMATSLKELPGTDLMYHTIDTGDSLPIRRPQFRHSPADRAEISRQVGEMLEAGVIEPSDSPYRNPVLLATKSNGQKRFCVDMRGVNSVTRLSSWPLPTFDQICDTVAVHKPTLWSSLDMKAGYWQTKIAPADRCKTAFETDDGCYQFTRTSFGLCGAPGWFQRLMQQVFRGMTYSSVLIYIDDVLCFGHSADDMFEKLQQVFNRFRCANLRIHGAKSHFAVRRVKFLGHFFDEKGQLHMDPDKLSVIRDYRAPTTPKRVRQWLGLTNYYKRFIKDYSQITSPMRELLKKDAKWRWDARHQEAFETLKEKLMSAPVLALPDFSKRFILQTDASKEGVGSVLLQLDDAGREHPVAYYARALRSSERLWSTTDLESLALVESVRHFHTYLVTNEFTVQTDHISLTYIQKMRLSGIGRLTRWALFLQPYRFKIEYKKGADMGPADALSRMDHGPQSPVDRPVNSVTVDRAIVKNSGVTGPQMTQERNEGDRTTAGDNPIGGDAHEEGDGVDDVADEVLPDSFVCTAEAGGTPHTRTLIEFDLEETGFPLENPSNDCVNALHLPPPPVTIPSLDEIRIAYEACPDFGPMVRYLANGELPADDQLARRITLTAEDYVLEDDILYHLFAPRTRNIGRAHAVVRQLAIPTGYREAIALAMHDGLCHLGFDRCYSTTRMRYWFPGMYAFLKRHISTCLVCQQSKRPIHPGKVPMTSLPVAKALTRWCADWHGPIRVKNPRSGGLTEKKYILVIIDSTSMWVELVVTDDCSAETAMSGLFDCVISRYGLPRSISLLTDNGSSFISQLAKLFCKTFGIKQYFTTPYHPQTNSRAEEVASTIYSSLRVLSEVHEDWVDHVQAVALAYRAAACTNTGLSPHEVVFGSPMPLAIDYSLLDGETISTNLADHAAIIRPKLEAIRQVAMENARLSAERHVSRHNLGADDPAFKVGDKILLHDPTTKKGENSKLKRRYTGPFVIVECLPNLNFKLRELSTGKSLQRPVHAGRMSLLRELDNDYRISNSDVAISLFRGQTARRKLEVQVQVGDILESQVEAIVNPANVNLRHEGGLAQHIARRAGLEMSSECNDHVNRSGPLAVGEPFLTSAGDLPAPIRYIIHVAGPDTRLPEYRQSPELVQSLLCNSFYNSLVLAENTPDVTAIALPAISGGVFGVDRWSVAQAAADAINRFDADTGDLPGSLKRIYFVNLTLSVADTMSAVFRELLQVPQVDADQSGRSEDTLVEPPSTDGSQATDGVRQSDGASPDTADTLTNAPQVPIMPGPSSWYPIEAIINHRQKGRRMEYLVKWQGSDETTWVDRKDVTDFAVQQFYANRGARRRRRKRF